MIQLDQIKNHIDYALNHLPDVIDVGYLAPDDAWTITETDTEISGGTIIDNFDMDAFLKVIGIPDEHIKWGDY